MDTIKRYLNNHNIELIWRFNTGHKFWDFIFTIGIWTFNIGGIIILVLHFMGKL